MNVDAMLRCVSSRQLTEWQAYLHLEEEERTQGGLNKRAAATMAKAKAEERP